METDELIITPKQRKCLTLEALKLEKEGKLPPKMYNTTKNGECIINPSYRKFMTKIIKKKKC